MHKGEAISYDRGVAISDFLVESKSVGGCQVVMFVSSFPSQELKLCSVVLDRLEKDAEEKEDMSRKAGKLVSRIPTFQKRSAAGGQITDPPASRGETPLHAASEATGAAEESKRKPPEVKETVSVHTPRVGVGTAPVFSSEAQAALGAFSAAAHADWSLSESAQSPFLSVSARPALRPELLSSEAEAVGADASTGILPHDGSACPKQTSDTDQSPAAAGDVERSPADVSPTRGDQVAAIMDEEPPWETEPMSTADIRDSRSSSDAEGDDKSDDSEHLQLPVSQSGAPNLSEKEASREESSVAAEFSSKVRNVPIFCFHLLSSNCVWYSEEMWGTTPSCRSHGM